MRMSDALFNWLQIEIVAANRADDQAARDTRDFFLQILTEDHGLSELHIAERSEETITISYAHEGNVSTQSYPREAAEQLLADINANPKYN